MSGRRFNACGVLDSIDQFRTINGLRWAGDPHPGDERVAEYRAAGVRCRVSPDRQTIFVHPEDADTVDKIEGSTPSNGGNNG